MRRAVLASIIALLVLPVLGMVAGAAEPLAADIQHGIVVWRGSAVLYKKSTGPNTLILSMMIGGDDIREIRGWPGDTVYIVVFVSSIDNYASVSPLINARIRVPSMSANDLVYETPYISIPAPGTYTIAVPKMVFNNNALDAGARLEVHLIDTWITGSGAPDNYYSVRIMKVVLAPPQGVVHDQPQGQPHGQVVETSARLSDGARLAIAVGAGLGFALLVFVAARRRL